MRDNVLSEAEAASTPASVLVFAVVLVWVLATTLAESTALRAGCVFCAANGRTAVEATVDRISDEQHRLSGQAKDLGSAAVFLSLLLAALVWGTVAWERFAA